MFLSAISSLLSAWFAFFLPCYATFKVLSKRPISEPDLQKYAMYWSVIGAFVAFEYLAEWSISWLPLYWEAKTAFLLYISLPQIQGSTYIYSTYLQPFFTHNEKELDDGIVAFRRNILIFLQAKLTALWEFLWSVSTKQRGTASPTMHQDAPPISWLSPDAVRSALKMVYSTSGARSTPAANPTESPMAYENSSPFPVPQANS